ncbi:competence protein CoiA [Bradyrhizobium sp. 2TAF36]|uniref:competence protein CoiA n=1 Tax=Bradyrhizobium sp. 2TAF36 TaxID=3233016 RepID=UPI003F90E513
MKYALAAGQRVEASPDGRATCPTCNGEVIAKCGSYRIWHWAHRGMQDCDSWAEKETEWHRAWKNRFPADHQEVVLHDGQSGERHVADVRTSHGLVIEFQHSHLDPKERTERESFYGNMLWVVDGTRLKGDYPRFLKGIDRHRPIINGHFLLAFPEECLPKIWLESSVPVIFDFRGVDASESSDHLKNVLWCLLPGRAEGNAVLVGMSPEQFVSVAPSRAQLIQVMETLANISQVLRELRAQQRYWSLPLPPGGRPLRRPSPRFWDFGSAVRLSNRMRHPRCKSMPKHIHQVPDQ